MSEVKYLDNDVIRLRGKPKSGANSNGKDRLVATLFWGDNLRVQKKGRRWAYELTRLEWDDKKKRYQAVTYVGLLPEDVRFREKRLLKVRFVDVGQGDAGMVETPAGRVLLIDGGEGDHLLHYINKAYSHVVSKKPLHCDAVIVTHGDADHFRGLIELASPSSGGHHLLSIERVYHNGIVKRNGSSGANPLGRKRKDKTNGQTWLVDLEDNLLNPKLTRKMSDTFALWAATLNAQQTLQRKEHKKLLISRLEYGNTDAFNFLAPEGIEVQVLGPITELVSQKPALPFLHTPGSSALSASHTINGHSIVLKMAYKNVRFLFGADLNQESEERLLERANRDGISLAAEVLKVPHHGSADFSPRVLEAIRPVVSVISSGDENSAREYIHPRSGLVGALGKFSRPTVVKPLIYVTEMVAFFESLAKTKVQYRGQTLNNIYHKRTFGIVHVRTDGERVLVVTNGGREDQKESYAFKVDSRGDVSFEEKTDVV